MSLYLARSTKEAGGIGDTPLLGGVCKVRDCTGATDADGNCITDRLGGDTMPRASFLSALGLVRLPPLSRLMLESMFSPCPQVATLLVLDRRPLLDVVLARAPTIFPHAPPMEPSRLSGVSGVELAGLSRLNSVVRGEQSLCMRDATDSR